MATSFPTGLDSLTNPASGDTLNSPSHAGQHADANDAIEALQAKVGVNGSAVATSLDYKINNDVILKTFVAAKGDLISASANDTPLILSSTSVNNHVLMIDTTTASGLKWAAPVVDDDQYILASQVFS